MFFALGLNKATCLTHIQYVTGASAHIYLLDHVYFHHSLSKRERGETSSELSFQSDYASDFC